MHMSKELQDEELITCVQGLTYRRVDKYTYTRLIYVHRSICMYHMDMDLNMAHMDRLDIVPIKH